MRDDLIILYIKSKKTEQRSYNLFSMASVIVSRSEGCSLKLACCYVKTDEGELTV